MNWLSQRIKAFKDWRRPSAVPISAPAFSIGCYAQSEYSIGAQIFRNASDMAESRGPLANITAFATSDGLAYGSLLIFERDDSAAGLFYTVLNVAKQFLDENFGQSLAICHQAVRRATPLAQISELETGQLSFTNEVANESEGRYLLRWISQKNLEAGKVSDEYYHAVAALDVVRDSRGDADSNQQNLYANLAVYERLATIESDQIAAAWTCFVEQFGLGGVELVDAIEAVRLPAAELIWHDAKL